MVAEGATSCISVDDLAHREGLELPITHQVRAILYQGASPLSGGEALMGRAAKDELHGMGIIVDEET
jgi:glycerol-3-phosphate dehydrogenase (NAD(P)+)